MTEVEGLGEAEYDKVSTAQDSSLRATNESLGEMDSEREPEFV